MTTKTTLNGCQPELVEDGIRVGRPFGAAHPI